MPAVKVPMSLHEDNKRPDGTTLLPWSRGKPMACDVTVPDTYAESHIGSTATKPCAAALKTTQNKIDKYAKLTSTHSFYLFAAETAGTWHDMAIELTRNWQVHHNDHRGHHVNNIPFPTPIHSSPKGKCSLLASHYGHRMKVPLQPFLICLSSIFSSEALCWWAKYY